MQIKIPANRFARRILFSIGLGKDKNGAIARPLSFGAAYCVGEPGNRFGYGYVIWSREYGLTYERK